MARPDYTALIAALARDDAGIASPAQRDDALALAALRYAADRPGGGAAPVLTADEDTIPPGDREAVCLLAAATLLDQMAAHRAGDTDSTIAADAADRGGPARRYAQLAEAHRRRYRELMGLEAAPRRRPRAAAAVAAPARAPR